MNNISINSALEPLQVLVDSGKLIEAKAWMQANKDTFDPVMYDFNMGNILFKNGEYVDARIHIENSIKNGFYTPEATKLLATIRENLRVNQLETLENWTDYYNYSLKSSFGAWQTTSLLLFIFIVLSFIAYSTKSIKKMWISLFIILIMVSPFIYSYKKNEIGILKADVLLRDGPSQVFKVTTEVPAGLKIIYIKYNQDWKKIIYPSSMSGWIKTEEIAEL